MPIYQKYLKNLTLCTSCLLILVILINWTIDPYGAFWMMKLPTIYQKGFNDQKLGNDRLIKPLLYSWLKPEVVIMGTSRVGGMPPEHPAYGTTTERVLNFGIPGARVDDFDLYVQFMLSRHHPRLIIFGIDFYSFNLQGNKMPTQESILNPLLELNTLTQMLMTVATLKVSIKSHEASKIGPIPQAPETFETRIQRFRQTLRHTMLSEDYFLRYKQDPRSIEHFQHILKICKNAGVEIKMFISPTHALQQEAIDGSGLWDDYENWKQKISIVAEKEGMQIWDFSDFNSITSEPIAAKMHYYEESSHYSEEVGQLILNRLFNINLSTVPADFGMALPASNMTDYLINIRKRKKKYEINNPEPMKLIEDIKGSIPFY